MAPEHDGGYEYYPTQNGVVSAGHGILGSACYEDHQLVESGCNLGTINMVAFVLIKDFYK